jgi:hypothetical protein
VRPSCTEPDARVGCRRRFTGEKNRSVAGPQSQVPKISLGKVRSPRGIDPRSRSRGSSFLGRETARFRGQGEAFDQASGVTKLSHFHDPAFAREVRAVAKLSGTRRYREFNRLALELERNLAPAAPFAIDASRDFFSARIGCQVYQPFFEMDLGALCLRR